ncbi:MAG: hypothetical protein Q9165_001834 [Trypethelium subeluteriae]
MSTVTIETVSSSSNEISIDRHSHDSEHGATIAPFDNIEDARAPEIEYPTGFKFVMICIAVATSLFLMGLDLKIVATAVPSITDEFKTITDIGWYSSAFWLPICSFQFMFGKIYSVFSIKWVFVASLAIFEIGSLVSATAPTSLAFVLGRAIAGFGCAGEIAGSFTMITLSLPLRRRPVFTGAAAFIEEVASVCGPLLGGIITDKLSWRWCFYINLPLGAVTILLIVLFFQSPRVPYAEANDPSNLSFREKIGKLDLLGTAIFVPGMTSMLLALQWGGNNYGWGSPRIIVCFILCAILIGVFAWWQRRQGDNATLPLRIIGNRSIISGMWFTVCNVSAYSIVGYYMPIYFQSVRNLSASRSGILTLPSIVGLMISIVVAGGGTSLIGYYAPFMFVTSLLTPIATGLLTTLTTTMPMVKLILYQALHGFGAGIGWQAPQVAAQSMSNPDVPLAIAAVMFAQSFGPAVSIPIAQAIFQQRLISDVGKTTQGEGLNVQQLASMGLSDLRSKVGAKELEQVLLGYDQAVVQTFYLPLGLACATIIGSLAMEWKSVKQRRD